MCDNRSFKLCTCDKQIPPNVSFWTLKRFADCDWTQIQMGQCFYPDYQDDEKTWINQVQQHLNTHQCFDNEYTPCQGDTGASQRIARIARR